MSVISIQPSFPVFSEADGTPLEAGYIYIGTTGLNPETNPITVYWDFAQTIPASQPIRTIGGRPSRSGSAANLYVSVDYSITVRDRNQNLVYSVLTNIIDSLGLQLSDTANVALGDALIGVKNTATGAVATTQHKVNERIIHYMDFDGDGIGVADNTTNLQAAFDGTPSGGTLDLGSSGIRITGNVSRLTPIHITGEGWEIIPDIDAVTDAVTLGNAAVSTYGWSMTGGGFYTSSGTSNKCQHALVIQRLHASKFDVTVLCAAALQGVKVSGTVYNDYKFTMNFGSPKFTTSYVRPTSGLWVNYDGVNQVNACRFHFQLLTNTGTGLIIDDQLGGGQSEYSGTIENCTGNPMEVTNVHGADFHDIYFEDNVGTITLTNVKFSNLTNWKRGQATTSLMTMTGCESLDVSGGQHRGDTWTIDATSRNISIDNIDLQGGALLSDLSASTSYGLGIQNRNIANDPIYSPKGHDRKNYASNSNFERWTATKPVGWNKPGAATWTKTGTGLGDTINRVNPFAALFTSTAVVSATYTPSDKATLIEHIKESGAMSVTLPAYFPTTVDNSAMVAGISLRIRVVSTAAGNTDYQPSLDKTILDAWQDLYLGGFVIPSDVTDVQFTLFSGEAALTNTLYLADMVITPSAVSPRAYIPEENNSSLPIHVKGNRIDFQAGIPAATDYIDGDVIFNSPATAGQPIGWVCTVSGTTLVAMANL